MDQFNQVIKSHLDGIAATTPDFAVKYANPARNLNDCITYILNTVKASGRQGFTDDEVYGMAMHYYDEDNIEVGERVRNMQVITNQPPTLTDDDIAEAKERAMRELIDEQKQKLTAKKSRPAQETNSQPTLF